MERNQREKYFGKLTRKCNQSLRWKHYPSGHSFCTNQLKFVKSTTAECNSNLNHSTYFWLSDSALYWHMISAAANKTEHTSWMFKSNQLVQKRWNKFHLNSKKWSYLCTTIEVIPWWSLDRYSSAAILGLTCNAQQQMMETHAKN